MTDTLAPAFAKVDRDLEFLSECLIDVIKPFAPEAAALLGSMLSDEPAPTIDGQGVQALTAWFQLLNIAEENAGMMARRSRQNEGQPEPGMWRTVLPELIEKGMSQDQLLAAIQQFHAEPVLTAHPTEAKRPEVLRLHREIYLAIFEREIGYLTSQEHNEIRERILASLERLWRCGETAIAKPSVSDELEQVLHFYSKVFPIVLPYLDRSFAAAWQENGLDTDQLDDIANWPRLSFGNWVGGDRDGHKGVTAATTHGALRRLRLAAAEVQREALNTLVSAMELSVRIQPADARLLDTLRTLAVDQGKDGVAITACEDPWRQLVMLLRDRMDAEIHALQAGAPGSLNISDIQAPMDILSKSLHGVGASRLARQHVLPVQRSLQIFGLNLANVDIRQNSDFHDAAVTQLLKASGAEDSDFANWSEERRVSFLMAELAAPESWDIPRENLDREAAAVLDCYRVLAEHIRHHGSDGLGSLIVSMTRSVSDLLVVHLLSREAGLSKRRGGWWRCPLSVVPLLETEADLDAGTGILSSYLALEPVRMALAKAQHPSKTGPELLTLPISQQVMVGYSDSNKDAGFAAGQWALYRAQAAIADAIKEVDVSVVFFHGRGGTASRGGGPTLHFLNALPKGSLHGAIRMTEQGETIAQKFANQGTATYFLEQLQASVVSAGALASAEDRPDQASRDLLQRFANASSDCYRKLLLNPDFLAYWQQASPIDALESSAIGSRPVRRTGKRTLEDLRAIPWVFSWTQNRHYLTGWYGFGSAFASLSTEEKAEFKTLFKSWSFLRNMVRQLQTNWASVDLTIARLYANLVEDEQVRESIYNLVQAEYDATAQALAEIDGDDWQQRRLRLHKTLSERADGLRLLHQRQVELLAAWRPASGEEREAMLPEVQLTINAITAGLRAMG
jgi:phosphoenolpyruvate carboxylase